MECDYLNGWIKKRSHTQKSHPKVVNPRDIAGERQKKKKKKKKKKLLMCLSLMPLSSLLSKLSRHLLPSEPVFPISIALQYHVIFCTVTWHFDNRILTNLFSSSTSGILFNIFGLMCSCLEYLKNGLCLPLHQDKKDIDFLVLELSQCISFC